MRRPSRPFPKELGVKDIEVGHGREAKNGRKVTIQFNSIRFNGESFESSWDFGNPFRFELGSGGVSPGWEEGLLGMKVGGRRELLLPSKIIAQSGIYLDGGADDGVVYVIDLLAVS